jgi:hypothetical protein
MRACFDGACRIQVVAPVTIPVDSQFGFPSVRVTVTGSEVTITAHPTGELLDTTSSVPGNASLNNLDVTIQALSGNTVTLVFSPG